MNVWRRTRLDWRSLAGIFVAGWLGASGTQLLFRDSLRESVFDGFGYAVMFTAFAWLAGQPRWAWSKATVAAMAMILGRLVGTVLAEPGVGGGDLTEGFASGAGASVALLGLAWGIHRRGDPSPAG